MEITPKQISFLKSLRDDAVEMSHPEKSVHRMPAGHYSYIMMDFPGAPTYRELREQFGIEEDSEDEDKFFNVLLHRLVQRVALTDTEIEQMSSIDATIAISNYKNGGLGSLLCHRVLFEGGDYDNIHRIVGQMLPAMTTEAMSDWSK